ncbi:MAG: hypothetical protein JWM62_2103 [Frankiales bacterium]|nr:hypothetical protein [Frankiales bacterium]
MSLPRLVSPYTVLETLTRGAIGNARAAATAIAEQVEDRRRLAPIEAPAGAGTLSRMGRAECLELLASRRAGRLAYIARAGVPDVVPVNYLLHGEDVLVRTGVGPKLQAAERGEVMTLEADDLDEEAQAGWSVVVSGPAHRLSAAEVRALADDALPRTWAGGPRFAVLRIRTKRVEGRRLS